MSAELERKVREFCDAWGDGSDASRPDVEKILALTPASRQTMLFCRYQQLPAALTQRVLTRRAPSNQTSRPRTFRLCLWADER